MTSNPVEFQKTLAKFDQDSAQVPQVDQNSESVPKKRKNKKKRIKAYEEVEPIDVPNITNLADKSHESNQLDLTVVQDKVFSDKKAPEVISPVREQSDPRSEHLPEHKIWGSNKKMGIKNTPADYYTPTKSAKKGINSSRGVMSREKPAISVQAREHSEEQKLPKSMSVKQNSVPRSVAFHDDYNDRSEAHKSSSKMPMIQKDMIKKSISNSSQGREQRINLNTKDYNKFNLQNAMLKDPHEDITSNQSSGNTYVTGKRTLNTMMNRRMSGAPQRLSKYHYFITYNPI